MTLLWSCHIVISFFRQEFCARDYWTQQQTNCWLVGNNRTFHFLLGAHFHTLCRHRSMKKRRDRLFEDLALVSDTISLWIEWIGLEYICSEKFSFVQYSVAFKFNWTWTSRLYFYIYFRIHIFFWNVQHPISGGIQIQ